MGAAGLNASQECASVQEADVMVMVSCQRKGTPCPEVAANTFGRAAAGTSMNPSNLSLWYYRTLGSHNEICEPIC